MDPAPPLIFITSNTSVGHSGRNARNHARAESARINNPIRTVEGNHAFINFRLDNHKQRITKTSTVNQNIDRNLITPTHSMRQRANKANPLKKRTLAQVSPGKATEDIHLTDLLAIARFHIRRRASAIAVSHPDRLVDALRCRQWSFSTPDFIVQDRNTPLRARISPPWPEELTHALVCVQLKLNHLLYGSRGTESEGEEALRVWEAYERALKSLRLAMERFDSARRERKGFILAAVQLLAVFEMLDGWEEDGSNAGKDTTPDWARHLDGALAVRMSGNVLDGEFVKEKSQAGSLIVEAMLGQDVTITNLNTWSSTVRGVLTEALADCKNRIELTKAMVETSSFVLENRRARQEGQDWHTQHHTVLTRAHHLRDQLHRAIRQAESSFKQLAQSSIQSDVLGICLATAIGLDRVIVNLRPPTTRLRPLEDIEAATRQLGAQMLAIDLNSAECHPTRSVLEAFIRQNVSTSKSSDI